MKISGFHLHVIYGKPATFINIYLFLITKQSTVCVMDPIFVEFTLKLWKPFMEGS